jgi:hypothetical protein
MVVMRRHEHISALRETEGYQLVPRPLSAHFSGARPARSNIVRTAFIARSVERIAILLPWNHPPAKAWPNHPHVENQWKSLWVADSDSLPLAPHGFCANSVGVKMRFARHYLRGIVLNEDGQQS